MKAHRTAPVSTTIISRRGFLRLGCCSVVMLAAQSALSRLGLMSALASSSSSYQALVCIFLFGGNDSNNTVVPLDSTRYGQYQSLRANLALSQSSLLPISDSAGNPYGLHPNLPEVQTLYKDGAAAVLLNTGVLVSPTTRAQYQAHGVAVPQNLFSHSDQQRQWQSAIPNSAGSGTGWGGRVADLMASAGGVLSPSISVAGNSFFLTGQTTTPATLIPGASLALTGSDGSALATARNAALQQILAFNSGFALVQAANGVMSEGLAVNKLLASVFAGATPLKTTFPATSLGTQLQQIAQLIQVRSALGASRQIFFASLGGFDTHSNELNTHVALLTQFSQALNAFFAATVELGVQNEVTSFTASDFGRTFQPSATNGSDHAWGSHHLIVGGSVKSDIYGAMPTFALGGPSDATNRGVWIPDLALDQYGATLASWFGVPDASLGTIFENLGNFSTANLGFLQA